MLVGIERRDTKDDIDYLARKLVNLKLWSNESGKPWRKSAKEKNFGVLLVSQFTLHAVLKGNKPDFHMSMVPDKASECFDQFVKRVEMEYGKKEAVEKGEFGAKMEVDLVVRRLFFFLLLSLSHQLNRRFNTERRSGHNNLGFTRDWNQATCSKE